MMTALLYVCLILPSWLLVRLALPWLPATHPWHGRRFTLLDWAAGATDATVWASAALWTCALTAGLVLLRLWRVG